MRILAIDPGSEQSAWLVYDTIEAAPCRRDGELEGAIYQNQALAKMLAHMRWRAPEMAEVLAIERIASYGMAVGRTVFDTAWWAGRFCEAWDNTFVRIERRTVKLHICGSGRAKDANIRQALIDRFPATGGGKVPQVGTRKCPGPLYGVKADLWSALAIAITAAETEAPVPAPADCDEEVSCDTEVTDG